jgi:MiaB-like tRNA modifying enzyme
MITRLKDFIIVDSEKDADIVVVNSCTVTNSADANIRSYISKQNKDGKRVILAGCGAFSKGEELLEQKKIFGVFGHSQKENINELLKRDSNFYELGDLKSVDKTIVSEFKNKTKAFIKIQEGCSFECSYCIIPSVRGKARSQDEKLILEQIKTLAKNGFGEFVLTGTNMGSYGRDKGSSLAKLLKRISKIDGVKRVRLGSIEPIQIDDEFKELLGESFLEKHLHIALQHTHKSMLKLMKRRNSLKKDLELFEYIADKGFALGTDFIVGHPGETQKIWQEAVENFKKFPLTHLHIFTFSKRDGTHSATLKDEVRGDIAKKRLKELKKIVKNNNYNFRKKHSKNLLVLVEENNQGYDQYFNLVKIDSKEALSKSWVYLDSVQVKKEGNFAVF